MEDLIRRHAVARLNGRPPVLVAFDVDFERNLDAFAAFSRANAGTTVLLQLGYEHETPELAAHLGEVSARFMESAAGARVIALGNKVRIVGPENVVRQMKEVGKRIMDQYD